MGIIKTDHFISTHKENFIATLVSHPQVSAFHKTYGAFHYTLQGRVATLTADGGTHTLSVTLPDTALYDKVLRKAHYYEFLTQPVGATEAKAQEEVAKQLGQPAGLKEKALAGVDFAVNAVSLARHGISVTHGPEHPLVTGGAVPLGVVWTVFSALELKQAVADWKRSEEIRDGEGKRRALGSGVSGTLGLVGSVAYVADKAAESASAALPALGAVLSPVADGCFGLGSIIGGSIATLGIVRCARFRRRLNEFLEAEGLSERERLRGALSFLLSMMTVTPDEAKGLSKEEIQNLAETKAKYFKRRATVKSLKEMTVKAAKLEERLKNETDTTAIEKAKALIRQVKAGNGRKIALFVFLLFAALVTIAALVLGTIATFGALPVILYAVSVAISLSLTFYNWYQQRTQASDVPGGSSMGPVMEGGIAI